MNLQTYIQVHFKSDLTSLKTSFCNPIAADLIHDPNSEFWVVLNGRTTMMILKILFLHIALTFACAYLL